MTRVLSLIPSARSTSLYTFGKAITEGMATLQASPQKRKKHSGRKVFVDNNPDDEVDAKKPKMQTNAERKTEKLPFKKKKMVLMLGYCGKDYQGMQINPGQKTIEHELVGALINGGFIQKHHAYKLSNMSFQRAARTDKGVSAAGQVVSVKMFSDVVNPLVKLNAQLPEHIRVFCINRVTKGFDSKKACTGRSYEYLIPTYAFCHFEEPRVPDYQIDDETLQKINDVLEHFKGTHNFHNFTSGKTFEDKSAFRYITEFKIGKPFIRSGVEFAIIKIQGQSFVMHQIRKMIGLAIAIVQGLTDVSNIERAWGKAKCDIPKAPGLGLLLDKCLFQYYNKKFGETHEPIIWEDLQEEIDAFKEKYIYSVIVDTEVKNLSMLSWMSTLHIHTFDDLSNRTDDAAQELRKNMDRMFRLHQLCKAEKLDQSASDDDSDESEGKGIEEQNNDHASSEEDDHQERKR